MKFNINVWRRGYDEVQMLGKALSDSRIWIDEEGITHLPIKALSIDCVKDFERNIAVLTQSSDAYLDYCGLGR